MKVQMENDSGSKRTDTTGRSHPHTLPAIPCTGALTKASIPTQGLTEVRSRGTVWMRANDPSAGSPTETLLRRLLPLSDTVH